MFTIFFRACVARVRLALFDHAQAFATRLGDRAEDAIGAASAAVDGIDRQPGDPAPIDPDQVRAGAAALAAATDDDDEAFAEAVGHKPTPFTPAPIIPDQDCVLIPLRDAGRPTALETAVSDAVLAIIRKPEHAADSATDQARLEKELAQAVRQCVCSPTLEQELTTAVLAVLQSPVNFRAIELDGMPTRITRQTPDGEKAAVLIQWWKRGAKPISLADLAPPDADDDAIELPTDRPGIERAASRLPRKDHAVKYTRP